jgi:hypothetical protein
MRICRRCGAFAPRESSVCDWCNQPLAEGAHLRDAVAEAPRLRQRVAAAQIEHACGACGARTPIDGLPADQVAACGWCGARHRLRDADWRLLLDRIHAVADLVADHPEGFEPSPVAIDEVNPFGADARRSGVIRFAHDEAGAVRGLPESLRLVAAPGVPLDEEDAEPLVIEPTGRGGLRVRAEHGSRRYSVPAAYLSLYPQLVGLIAHDHEVDADEQDVEQDEAGRWICPSCGDRLRRADGSRFRVRCGACNAVARLPAALRHHKVRNPKPDTLWVLFEGPSPERRRLERAPSESGAPLPDDRPLETMPLLVTTPRGRALQALYVAVVPLVLLGIAGLVSHGGAWLRELVGAAP